MDSELISIKSGGNKIAGNNVIDNSESTEFVSVRATAEYPLVGATYNNESYVGTVTEAEQITSYSAELPSKTIEKGMNSYQSTGADVSKLSVVTAATAGPDYLLQNTSK
ncbi:MAG: hypothetical protein V7782_04515 [Psychromonas sp.]